MKSKGICFAWPWAWALLSFGVAPAAVEALVARTRGLAVTRVVEMLQEMMQKSEADGAADREVFAKFKCYCDRQKETKGKEISDLSQAISLSGARIEELQGSTGGLSQACAELKSAIAENQASQDEATRIRTDEEKAFQDTRSDLMGAISQMEEAIKALSEVGADQTLVSAADHKEFMAGKNVELLRLQSRIKDALTAASALTAPEQKKSISLFLQAPFTGAYTSHSGEVLGILKSMMDTFKANLENAESTNEKQLSAFDTLLKTLSAEKGNMETMYQTKQGELAENDKELASQRQLLSDANTQKTTKEDFLAELLPMCEGKTKEYEERKALRANEEAAIAQAVAILNSDTSFATFRKVKATGSLVENFLQRSALTVHPPDTSKRARIVQLLLASKSARLAHLASSLRLGNPFAVVLEEITKVLASVDEEGKADTAKRDWCRNERSSQSGALDSKTSSITMLETTIGELTSEIEAPIIGLRASIQTFESSLVDNSASQESASSSRNAEHDTYLKQIADVKEAQELLVEASKVLSTYYAGLGTRQSQSVTNEAAVLPGEMNAVPTTWEAEKGYQGQNDVGNSVISLLQFIYSETQKEGETLAVDEEKAQKSFEELLNELKEAEGQLQRELTLAKNTLAQKEEEKAGMAKDLLDTIADEKALREYLLSLKPGCDFIDDNFEKREQHRTAEKGALEGAIALIKGTPAYLSAEASSKV